MVSFCCILPGPPCIDIPRIDVPWRLRFAWSGRKLGIMEWFMVHYVVDLKRSLFSLPWLALRRTGLKRTWMIRLFRQVDCPPSGVVQRGQCGCIIRYCADAEGITRMWIVEWSSGAVADAGKVVCVGGGCWSRGIQMLLMWNPGSCGTVSWWLISMASLTLRVFQLLMEVMIVKFFLELIKEVLANIPFQVYHMVNCKSLHNTKDYI